MGNEVRNGRDSYQIEADEMVVFLGPRLLKFPQKMIHIVVIHPGRFTCGMQSMIQKSGFF
jgi:hypothetical protein